MTPALGSQEDFDGGKKLCGFAYALLGSLAFSMKRGIAIGEKPVVLFFGTNLRQPYWQSSRFDRWRRRVVVRPDGKRASLL